MWEPVLLIPSLATPVLHVGCYNFGRVSLLTSNLYLFVADSQQQNGTNGGNIPDHSTFPIHAGESEKFGPVLPKHAPSLTRFIGEYVHMYTYIRAHICVHIMYMCLLR